MHSSLRHILALLPMAFMLGACTLAPVRPVTQQQADAVRDFHESIDIGGRLSVRYLQQGEPQLLTGSFNWIQRSLRTQVTLLSPFGQTIARLEVTPQRATFQRAGEPLQSAADVDQLTANALGWPLPVSGLRSWLQGFVRIAPDQRVAVKPATDAAITSDDGWRIVYSNWSEAESTAAVRPRRIDVSRQTREAGEVQIRIILDNWQPMAATTAPQ